MATPQDADLILKLYELRREKTMRKARSYVIVQFFPQNVDEIKAIFFDRKHPEYNAYLRQTATYWDMAAALVNHGAVDRDLFLETNGELFAVWAKFSDHLIGLREFLGPQFLANVEKLVNSHPDNIERAKQVKERIKKIVAQIAAQEK
jgi:hypothetical protein